MSTIRNKFGLTIKAPLYILQIVGKRNSGVLQDREIHDLIGSVYLNGAYMSDDYIDYFKERANGQKNTMTVYGKPGKAVGGSR